MKLTKKIYRNLNILIGIIALISFTNSCKKETNSQDTLESLLLLSRVSGGSSFSYDTLNVMNYGQFLGISPRGSIQSAKYTISPALPGGISISESNGTVSGIPEEEFIIKEFTVTATTATNSVNAILRVNDTQALNSIVAPIGVSPVGSIDRIGAGI